MLERLWEKARFRTHLILGELRQSTIRSRVLSFFTLLLGAICLFIYVFFPGAIQRQALEGIEAEARSIGAVAAHSVRVAMNSPGTTGFFEALEGTLQNDDVTKVEVLDVDGAVLATFPLARQPGKGQPPRSFSSKEVFSYSSSIISQTGSTIGTVRLELSLAEMKAQVARARELVALVSLAIFAFGVVAVIVVSGRLTAPLREMAAAAEKIASGDLGSRAQAKTNDEVGQVAHSFNHMVDRLQRAHEELALAKGQLEQVLDNIPADVVMYDPDGHFLYANPAAIQDPEEREWVFGKTPLEYAQRSGVGKDVGQEALEAVKQCVKERRLITTEQIQPFRGESERSFIRFFSPIIDAKDTVTRVIAYGLDITDLREAEAELRDTQERLLQAQKMESIGRLAGGIAHDFNNLLTTITGNADLVLMDLAEHDPSREDIDEIHKAANRASALTQQLLAFSRKQVTQPKILNLNDTVRGIQRMLQRLIGEDVKLATRLQDELGSIKADPGQIEQVIVNLAVNARDAMPRGGALTVKTEDLAVSSEKEGRSEAGDHLPPGEYVLITVSDTGLGMDGDTMEKIFEPFFTQKGPGKGTGLGLATVYGIVQQSDGFVRVYSEVGLGTTFKLFFPRVNDAAEAIPLVEEIPDLASGTETILVTEDQDGVRDMTLKILTRCGYNVLAAEGPEAALELARTYEDQIHLVLTDVVMPQMSGPELARELAPILPNAPVIFMSGYTDDQLQHHGVLVEGVVLLEKPFTAKNLATVVRSALDAGGDGRYQARSALSA